jgi:DNA primase
VREAQTLSGFLLAELRAPADLATPEGRSGLLAAARPHLQRTEAPALRLQLVKEIATLARVSQEEAEQLLGLAASSVRRRPAPRRAAAPPIAATQERNLLRCVLVNPALVCDLEADLLDARRPESAALQAIAESVVDGGAMSVAVLIDRFRDSAHAEVLYQAQASALEEGLSDAAAEQQFRQIQLALRIQRKHEEFDVLKREAADGRASRDLMVEIDRRAKELAELKSQRL